MTKLCYGDYSTLSPKDLSYQPTQLHIFEEIERKTTTKFSIPTVVLQEDPPIIMPLIDAHQMHRLKKKKKMNSMPFHLWIT
jgi:hypothetical protein